MAAVFFSDPEKKITRSLFIYFLTLQLLLGLDFGFSAPLGRSARVITKLVSILTVSVITISVVFYYTQGDLFKMVLLVTFYFLLISVIFSKCSLYNFFKMLYSVDGEYNLNPDDSRAGLMMGFYTITWLCIKTITDGFYYYNAQDISEGAFSEEEYIPLILYKVISLIFDAVPAVNTLIYYVIYIRLKYLRREYEKFAIGNKDVMRIYKAVSDCFDSIRVPQGFWVVLMFFAESAIWVMTQWFQLFVNKNQATMFLFKILMGINSLHLTLQICVPAVVAELISAETDALSRIVHERLLFETDMAVMSELTRLRNYLGCGALMRPAWRLVPRGLRLPVSLFSMAVTYLIVLLQFTHMY